MGAPPGTFLEDDCTQKAFQLSEKVLTTHKRKTIWRRCGSQSAWGCDGKNGAITYDNQGSCDHISDVSLFAVQFLGEGMGQQTTGVTLGVLESYTMRVLIPHSRTKMRIERSDGKRIERSRRGGKLN
jgi:hypothetical protein